MKNEESRERRMAESEGVLHFFARMAIEPGAFYRCSREGIDNCFKTLQKKDYLDKSILSFDLAAVAIIDGFKYPAYLYLTKQLINYFSN